MPSERETVRIRSDYVGAGRYLVAPDDSHVIVNTPYGVQAVSLEGKTLWRVDLIERCLGLARVPGDDERVLACTFHAVHAIDNRGRVLNTRPTRHEIALHPVLWGERVLIVTRTRVYAVSTDGEVLWRYRLRESLGDSVRGVITVGVHAREGGVVVGAVDHDSGIGRAIVLAADGELKWQSDPGPLTNVFPAGDDDFVYTLSGYGRFECYRCASDGAVRWRREGGGPGVELPDGRLAMLVGGNESPEWDDWEIHVTDAGGKTSKSFRARGHSCSEPVLGPDGCLYFSGYFRPIDPAESRVEYTSFFRPPRFVAYDQLRTGAVSPDYDVFFFRQELDGGLKLLWEDTDSLSLGPPAAGREHAFLVHGRDIVAVPAG